MCILIVCTDSFDIRGKIFWLHRFNLSYYSKITLLLINGCCCCLVTQSCPTPATPWTAAQQASLSLTISWSLPKFMPIASMMQFNHLILWCPLLLLPSIFPSIRDFSSESAVHIGWLKYWSFSVSINLSSEYSGLIFFKFDWFHFLDIHGNLRSLLQHHSSKASVLWWSPSFIV